MPDLLPGVPGRPARRSLLKALGAGSVGLTTAPILAGCTRSAASGADPTPTALLPAPEQQAPPQLGRDRVGAAVERLGAIVEEAMASSGVPGIAVAVVHQDRVVYAEGFGVREVGRPERVGPDTVFQVASVSKPLASTVVAAVVGQGRIDWDDPAVRHDPAFALNDPYVTAHATFADLLSHRSGLRTSAGDLLEDLRYGREEILSRLHREPLDTFRSSYHYSNFGYTMGAVAAASAAGMAWEDLAEELLFTPLGMPSSSYRHADYAAAPDRAVLHVREGGGPWQARYQRHPDAQAPAGGASSTIRDLARWMRLQLAVGQFEGKQVVDADALAQTHVPHTVSGAPSVSAGRTRFYGLGWNVSYDAQARLQLGHSGAFYLGAATAVQLLPGEQLGIVVLTNGQPEGTPEAIANAFLDTAQHGEPTVDWLGFLSAGFRAMREADTPEVDYSVPPATSTAARASGAYAGTYDNTYWGPLTVTDDGAQLTMQLGPEAGPTTFRLSHYDADTFSFPTVGENANGLAGAIFAAGDPAPSVRLDFYDRSGLGTFVRADGTRGD